MPKKFNVTGDCKPNLHYMVDLHSRLEQIKLMIDDGQYFAVNRGRQYGKTTTLSALVDYLHEDYTVIYMDFQSEMSSVKFKSEKSFAAAFADAFLFLIDNVASPDLLTKQLNNLQAAAIDSEFDLVKLFRHLSQICGASERPIILMIDEVDSASNNQVFLDFLAQLRGAYLRRNRLSTFHSVILAGVHDIRNLQIKIRPDSEHKHNSPWNIASDFDVDMSFSPADIAGMLNDYEADHHTGMDIPAISQLIYDYTSGYPVLVSMICKLMDENTTRTKIDSWNTQGLQSAVKQILTNNFPLLESLMNKLEQFPELKTSLEQVMEKGRKVAYNPDDEAIKQALMYGFVKVVEGNVVMANRIFEIRFYNALLTTAAMQNTLFYKAGEQEKPLFVKDGHLNMELILEKFVEHYIDVYGEHPEKFVEDDGRKLFMLYLKPIINGTGNYYIEPQTRDQKRMDLIVDYLGEQFIIELKIWRGNEYHNRGEEQLSQYLEYFHLQKGYMLSFNFNQKKKPGVHTIKIDDKTLVEAVV